MSEWKRLTPDTITTTSEAKYRPIHEGLFSHHIEAGCSEISLSNAELDALACYAPAVKAREEQVKALMEAATAAAEYMLDTDLCDADKEWRLGAEMREALANIKEAGDE